MADSMHVALFAQGILLHSSTSTAQVSPTKPPVHVQVKYPVPIEPLTVESAQAPPFWHGADVQGVTSQFAPENPLGHAQLHDAGGPVLKTLTPPF